MAAAKLASFGCALMIMAPLAAAAQTPGSDDGADRRISAQLSGYEETPLTVSTPATGTFKAFVTRNDEIVYELSYTGLESDITQAHIHFGRPGISGGIAAWLCGTASNPGPVTNPPPSCVPGREGTVTGTLTAANVIGPSGQGIAAGEWEELIAAINAGATYANVHTAVRPGGEIRGLVK